MTDRDGGRGKQARGGTREAGLTFCSNEASSWCVAGQLEFSAGGWIFGWKGKPCLAQPFIASSRCYNGQHGFFFFFDAGRKPNFFYCYFCTKTLFFFAIVTHTSIMNLI